MDDYFEDLAIKLHMREDIKLTEEEIKLLAKSIFECYKQE